MSMSTALIANVALDLLAIVPIYLLARWAITTDRSDRRTARVRAPSRTVMTRQGLIQASAEGEG